MSPGKPPGLVTYGILSASIFSKLAPTGATVAFILAAGLFNPIDASASEPVAKADARLTRSLMRLDSGQRFQQMCDVAAMKSIAHGGEGVRPDRAMLDAVSSVRQDGDTLSGDGGVIRSKGKWRKLSFTCVATPDRLTVLSFTYKLGDEIPESDWERYNLWP